eukprot:TRINITY_DN104289_c0_g1_i1.p1 TRINITY_DN104289_c0_g1~~TRINITY_DN104289_c0_g1_i1.p1  ORF type:complete len:647 (+),score=90.66 TRINITY_DN104289_c0_g1_i1:166-1941(+)
MDSDTKTRCAPICGMKNQPEFWGLRVRLICNIWEYGAENLQAYSQAHMIDEEHSHVCRLTPCFWQHPPGVQVKPASIAKGKLRAMKPDMKLLVQLYVKPWTSNFHNAGLSLIFNAGHLLRRRNRSAVQLCRAEVFISHCWNEAFEDFFKTVHHSLCIDKIVWVCSFALWQHGDIAISLRNVETSPFATAMRSAKKVLAITDSSTELLGRSWCVLEAKLAQQWNKPYTISLPNNTDARLWRDVVAKVESINLEDCEATIKEDKEAILAYAKQHSGGIEAVNQAVRNVARSALRSAEMMAAAKTGNVERLLELGDELQTLRSLRGRTVHHILARYGHIGAMVKMVHAFGDMIPLSAQDDDGLTPLIVAAQGRAPGSVKALIALRAEIDATDKDGLTALSHATAVGDCATVSFLLEVGADHSVQGNYRCSQFVTPAGIACREGHVQVLRELLEASASIHEASAPLLNIAALHQRPQAVALLLAAKADVDSPMSSNHMRTPLMMALESGCLASAGLLLAARANAAAQDDTLKTCYDFCSGGRGEEDCVLANLLLQSIAEDSTQSVSVTCDPSEKQSASIECASPGHTQHQCCTLQ